MWAKRLGFQPHAKQIEVMACPKRFRVASCGRQVGKSTLALYEAAIACLARPGTTGALLAPLKPHADNLFNRFLAVMDDAVAKGYVEYEHRQTVRGYLKLSNYSEVYCGNLVWPDVWRGYTLDWLVLDEASLLDSEVAWKEVLEPALAVRMGWALFISTPWAGSWFNRLYQREREAMRRLLVDEGLTGEELERELDERLPWAFFRFESYHNPYAFPLGADDPEWQRIRRSTDSHTFLQEYCAVPLPPRSLVYPEFDAFAHVLPGLWLPERPVHLAIDPSVGNNPYAVVVIQELDDEVRVVDEYYMTRVSAAEVIEDLRHRPWWNKVEVAVCDEDAPHDIRVWREHPAVSFDILGSGRPKPTIKETVRLVSEYLRNPYLWDRVITRRRQEAMERLGLRGRWEELPPEDKLMVEGEALLLVTPEEKRACAHLLVDQRCINTIREFQSYKFRERRVTAVESNQPEQPRDYANHCMDALRYWFYRWRRRREAFIEQGEGGLPTSRPTLEILAERRLGRLLAAQRGGQS